MNKYLKIFFLTIFSFLLLTLFNTSEANSINNISMDIFVDNDGNASITEIWKCNTDQGTEVYHPYYNLGNSKITDLSVTENNTIYTTLSSWKTSGTLSDKAYKCGINKISNGLELCWGISNYGSHTYIVKYNISNFVSDLTDSQMIYWTLIPYNFSNTIGNVYIKIHSNFNISDSVGVWGYGNYGGTSYVYDGYIEMQSSGSLSSSEYMTILVQFPSNTFNCNNKLNHDFNYYYEMAEEGSTHYEGSSSVHSMSYPFSLLISFILFIVNLLPIFIIAVVIISVFTSTKSNSLNFGDAGKKLPKNINYFRDIPCNNDLHRAYFIAYHYGILKNKTDILGAIILKWIKDSLVRLEQREDGKIFKKENIVIILTETDTSLILDSNERDLFNMLYKASKDGILENNEFQKWCNDNYSKILNWFDAILNAEQEKLTNEGLLTLQEKRTFKFFKYNQYLVNPELKNEAIKIAGLKKYLLDYTLIKDREAIEVTLFEYYLIFAQMLGIAKKVAEQFKKLYPNIIEQSNFTSYDNFYYINLCTNHGIRSANTAKTRAENYSSGGGGFSSGGGGGGSFGGGSGGGGFR